MFDYLQKFNNLPKDVKSKVSSPGAMAIIDELESKYLVELAAVVMKVTAKIISIIELPKYLSTEFNLDEIKAKELARELKARIFNNVFDDLNEKKEIKIDNFNQEKDKSIKLESIPVVNRKEKIKEVSAKELNFPGVNKKNDEIRDDILPSPAQESKNVNFFFSAEDEDEIKELTNKIENNFNSEKFTNDIDSKVNEVIKKVDIDFGSAELLGRFREIFKTYFRGVRSEIDVKQSLLKPFNDGGLSFDIESANKIMPIIRENKDYKKVLLNNKPKKFNLPEDEKIKVKNKEIIKNREIEYDLVKAIKERGDKIKMALPKEVKEESLSPPPPPVIIKTEKEKNYCTKDTVDKRLAPPPPVIVEPIAKKAIKKIPEQKVFKKDTVNGRSRESRFGHKIKKKYSEINFKPNSQARIIKQTGRTQMEDVRYVPKVMSSIDELRYMDLISFRRLASTPEEIKNKILNKLELLEEEKYSKRLEGIRAWRICPTNNLYLSMGQESISTSKPIDAIIEERKEKGKDYLNHDEFEAILELNKKIRF